MKRTAIQGGRFLAVGSAAAAVHLGVLTLAVENARFSPLRANLLAFAVAFSVSYLGHYHLTFRHSGSSICRSSARWLAVSLASFVVNQSLYALALKKLGGACYLPLWLAITLAITLISYLAGKYWAFTRRSLP